MVNKWKLEDTAVEGQWSTIEAYLSLRFRIWSVQYFYRSFYHPRSEFAKTGKYYRAHTLIVDLMNP